MRRLASAPRLEKLLPVFSTWGCRTAGQRHRAHRRRGTRAAGLPAGRLQWCGDWEAAQKVFAWCCNLQVPDWLVKNEETWVTWRLSSQFAVQHPGELPLRIAGEWSPETSCSASRLAFILMFANLPQHNGKTSLLPPLLRRPAEQWEVENAEMSRMKRILCDAEEPWRHSSGNLVPALPAITQHEPLSD